MAEPGYKALVMSAYGDGPEMQISCQNFAAGRFSTSFFCDFRNSNKEHNNLILINLSFSLQNG
jgi:hypothetical protein